MPRTPKGRKILASMRKTYPTEQKANEVFYGSIHAGKISGAEGRKKPGHSRASVAGYRKRA